MDRKSAPSRKMGLLMTGPPLVLEPQLVGEWSLGTPDVWTRSLFVELKLIFNLARNYLEAVKRGWFTRDPADYHDRDVCAPYIGKK